MKKKTGKRSFNCSTCGKTLTAKKGLILHLRTHSGERPYKCKYCDKAYPEQKQLTQHIRSHTGERPFKCTACPKAFISSKSLTLHKRTHTGERPHKCSVCGWGFASRSNLYAHKRIHTGERPYNCSVCGKAFTQRGQFNLHMKIHSGDRPHACTFCDRAFFRPNELKAHIRTHTGEYPYSCGVCGTSFIHRNRLTKHLKAVHTGERPFKLKCSICHNVFTSTSGFKIHCKTHFENSSNKDLSDIQDNKKKPNFICIICGKYFRDIVTLMKHKEFYHGKVFHKCFVCDELLPNRSQLEVHLAKLHAIYPNQVEKELLSMKTQQEIKVKEEVEPSSICVKEEINDPEYFVKEEIDTKSLSIKEETSSAFPTEYVSQASSTNKKLFIVKKGQLKNAVSLFKIVRAMRADS